jgi:preprotein translocase subunit SecE
MAERNRPADDAADQSLEDELFRADDELEDDEPAGRGGTATRTRPSADKARREGLRVGFFGRIGRFFREVVAELRKVIWPTRRELLTYTTVVVTFLTVVTAIVAGLDYGFARLVLLVFGKKS